MYIHTEEKYDNWISAKNLYSLINNKTYGEKEMNIYLLL